MRHIIILVISTVFFLNLVTGCEKLAVEKETQMLINSSKESVDGPVDEPVDEETQGKLEVTFQESDNTEKKTLSCEEKVEDFEFLFENLANNYPFFEMNKRVYGVDWLGNKESYLTRIVETESDLKFFLVLNSIINDLNYSHARVIDNREYPILLNIYKDVNAEPWLKIFNDPVVRNRYLSDTQNDENNSFTELQVYPNNIVLEKWTEYNTAYIKINSFNHANIEIDWVDLKPFLDELGDFTSLIIDIRGNGGGDSHYWSDYLIPELIYEPKEFTQYYFFRGGEYSESFVDFTLGCKYSEMKSMEELPYDDLSDNLPEELLEDFQYFFKNTLLIEPNDDEGYRGDIYLLIDHGVASSSDMFVNFVKDNNFAYIVGEQTLGEGSSFDTFILRLPNSGYIIRFPGAMVLNVDGINREEFTVIPDLQVDKRDALDEVINLILDINE